MTANVVEKSTWDDEGVTASEGSSLKDRYFGLKTGVKHVIRILSNPYKFERFWIPELNRYVKSSGSTCPARKKGYKSRQTWSCLILHIADVKNKTATAIGMLKIWQFSDANKYVLIKETKEAYEDYGDITKYEIVVTCSEEKFQRIGLFQPVVNKDKWLYDKSMKADIVENKDALIKSIMKPITDAEVSEILDGESDTVEDAKASTNNSEIEMELDEELTESPKKTKKKVQAKKGAKKTEDTEDLDADIESEVDDLLEE